MSKNLNVENRNESIIREIRNGASWEDLERKFKIGRTHMQLCLRKHYKKPLRYNLILVKARENSKNKESVIHVAETGALVARPSLLYKKQRVFVPDFCRNEIKSIATKTGESYDKLLTNPKICWTNISWERIKTLADTEFKPRTIGVAAFCCAMAKRNKDKKIKFYTNSYFISELITAQAMPNVEVVRV